MVTYIEREREREREREIQYKLCTLGKNITFMCTSLRNKWISGPLIKVIELLTFYCYLI